MYCSRKKDCGSANLRNASRRFDELTGIRKSVHVLQSDSDSVYVHGALAEWCDAEGIMQRFSAPYTQQHNGRAERTWRTMETSVASKFCYSGAPLHLWPYAVQDFCHAHNLTRHEFDFSVLLYT
jgi:transposase InsO family protein